MGETLEAIGGRMSPERMLERRKAAFGQRVTRVRETVMGTPGHVEDRAQGMAESTRHATDAMRERGRQTRQAASEPVRGNPLAAGLVAFGAGMLLAGVMPKTRTEQRFVEAARPQIDQAKDEMRDVGRELAGAAKERAGEGGDELRQAGSRATEHVHEHTQSAAGEVRSQTRRN